MIHAVLDTNVLLSAFGLSRGGPLVAIGNHMALGSFVNYTSPQLLDELARKLTSPKLAAAFPEPAATLGDIARMSILVEPQEPVEVFGDPDDRVLEAAVAAEATYVVTGDAAFLALGSYNRILILPPPKFRGLFD